MKKFKYLLFFCLIATQIFSQNTIKSRVVNAQNTEGVAYAAVGLIKENIGISTDENGYFELVSNIKDDSLIVSCVGYEKCYIKLIDIPNLIKLKPKTFELQTVTINPKKSKTIDINGFGKKNMGYDISNNVLKLMQIAQFIENPDGKSWYLKEINIARRKKTYLGKNQKTQFRVRFYGVDSEGKPNTKDIFESLIVKNESDRIIKINIQDKKLVLPRNGFFIAIEWIKIPKNYIDETYKTSVIRNGVDVGKETLTDRFYTPMISARKPYEKEKNCQVYELDYKGVWKHKCFQVPFENKGFSNNLNISVTVYD